MRKLFWYCFVLSSAVWGQAVSPTINQLPTRQFGHPVTENLGLSPTQAAPNLVLGQELDAPGQIAFDTSGSVPILYIADIFNNRVLAFKNPGSVTAGGYATVAIGQADLMSTLAQGPGTALETGLNAPTGVAVDSQGRLYVADAGNNRIMRFPSPLTQPNVPDLVIGQQGFGTGNSANEGSSNCAAKSLAFANGSGVQLTSLAIDASGNLWTTDPLNNRVLMYPAANLVANSLAPQATVVLGQTSFTTCSLGQNTANPPQLTKTIVVDPSGLVFDNAGNLYIVDAYSRVLYYPAANLSIGGQATRVLGIVPQSASSSGSPVYPTNYTLGAINPNNQNALIPPNGVFTNGTNLFVADSPSNRIIEYGPPSSWAAESTAFPSPAALNVFGQVGFSAGQANGGNAQPNSATVQSPNGGAFLGSQMWVSDTGNNRVIGFSVNTTGTYSNASVLIGQLDYIYNAPNLIVGSEVDFSGVKGAGIVVDNSSNPPHLYVADPGNNRILCFKNALQISAGSTLTTADMVIGQPDLKTSEINYPGGMAGQPTQTGLYSPVGIAVDNNGNLYVADYGNARVVRFPAPFNQPAGQPTANLVLGQASFTSFIQNASANSMNAPWGVALFADVTGATPLAGSLAVSDPVYNRVLIFKKPAGGDFANGQSAAVVIGQPSFSGFASGQGPASFNRPYGIASDTSDRLYVADAGNGRVLEFTQAPEGTVNGPTSTHALNDLNAPLAVAINSQTTELWVANTNSSLVYRYPEYTTCQITNCSQSAQLASYAPVGLAVDASGNVIVGDLSNRVTFYYAQLFYRNAANFNTQPLAPGMLAILGRLQLPMSISAGAASTNPWPTLLANLNVTMTVQGAAPVLAPIFLTNSSYGAIYFQVPYEAPTSGTATFMVTQASTGAVLGVGTFTMAQTNPGIFASNSQGTGPAAATNADGSVNSPANPVARGSTITLYLTGLGSTPSNPPDGEAPTAANAVNTPTQPLVYIDGIQATVEYSGIGGGFAGGWQINVTVPMTALPSSPNAVVLTYIGVQSNIGGTTSSDGITPGPDQVLNAANGLITTIAVK